MTCHLFALGFDANNPLRLPRFWAGVLGWEMADRPQDGIALLPRDDTGFQIRFPATQEPKAGPNRMHFHLTSTSLADQQQTVARSLGLGARHLDVGQRPEEGHIVLADPEGNEFCVIEPDNAFLAGCGRLGSITCDGSRRVGSFWSEALGWPLVWDQDEETAIRAPDGTGPFITWGPPVPPKMAKSRLHLDIAPRHDTDQRQEVDRLISLGAVRIDIGEGDVDRMVMADPDGNVPIARPSHPKGQSRVVLRDPDGNEFCLLGSRVNA